MNAELVKLSVCDCGFPVLAEHIPLKTKYQIDRNDKVEGKLICGGCKKEVPVTCVLVAGRDGGTPGYLPEQIFKDLA